MLDIWLENVGLPRRCREELLDILRRQGVDIDAGAILVGADRGLRLRHVTVYDDSLGRWPLLRADEVRVDPHRSQLMAGRLQFRRLSIDDANLALPLTLDSDGPAVRVEHLYLGLSESDDGYEIHRAHATFEKIHLTITGRLLKAPKTGEPPSFDPAKLLANRARIATISPKLLDRLLTAQRFCTLMQGRDAATVALSVTVPLEHLEDSQVEAAVRMQDFLWRGLAVERLAGRFGFGPDELRADDFRFQLSGGENLQGHLRLDRHTDEISGSVAFRMYPDRLLKLADVELLHSPYWPSFTGAPPYFSLTLEPSPVGDPIRWRVKGYGQVESTRVYHGDIVTARGHVGWDAGRLWVRDFLAALPGHTTIGGDYDYYPHTGQMLLRAQLNGNPLVVPAFAKSPPFQRDMDIVWREFRWDDVPPTFNVELCRYLDGDRPHFIVKGNASMFGATYKGQRVDAVSGNVLLDLPADRLVISNIKAVHDGKVATGNILYAFPHGHHWLEFDASSQLPPPILAGLINPKWVDHLNSWKLTFPQDATTTGSGKVLLSGEGETNVTVDVSGPEVVWGSITGRDFKSRLLYDGKQLKASLTADAALAGPVQATGLTTALTTNFREIRGEGTAKRLERDKLSASGITFDYEAIDGVVTGKASCLTGRLGGANPMQLADIRFDQLRVDHGVVTSAVSSGQISGDIVNVASVTGELRAAGNTVTLEGTGRDITVPAWKARTENCTFKLVDKPGQTAMDLTVPLLDCGKGAGAADVRCHWTQHADLLAGQGSASRITVPNIGQANDVVASFQSNGGAISFHQTCESLAVSPVQLSTVSCTGTLARGTVVADLSAYQGMVSKKYPVEQVNGLVTYQNGKVSFNYVKADVYGGKLQGNVRVDVERRDGQAHVAIDNMQLKHLMSGKNGKPAKGTIDVQSAVTFTYKNGDLQIDGLGEGHVRDGEIWRLPVLGEFIDLIGNLNIFAKIGLLPSSGDSSSITQADASFRYLGDRVHFDQITTNGSVLNITADGDYWWKTTGMNIRIRAHLLKNILPIAVFRPFMVLFERRRMGTLDKPEWEDLSAIKDVFRDTGNPVDPTLKSPPAKQDAPSSPPANTEK